MSTHNIKLPDGTTISVPAWASEDTLEKLADILDRNNDLADLMVTHLGGLGKDADEFQESLAKLRKQKVKTTKKQTDDINKRTQELGKTLTGIMSKFQDTDKPLTAMVDMASDLGAAGADATGKLLQGSAGLGKFSGVMGSVGKVMGDIGTAGAAYAGFVAGKIEQFAEVQRSLIDSGAIFFESSQAFDDLRRRSYDSGLSYQELGKVVSSYGVALQALGNGVTGGTDQFVTMMTDLNIAADQLGDFGLTSNDMATAYAEYIDVMRVTNSINRDTNQAQQDLQQGFSNLMVETTALANLTGENRSDILKRQMSALSDVEVAGGISILKERDQLAQARVAEEIAKQFALMAPETGAVGKEFSDAFNNALLDSADNIGRFDIKTKLNDNLSSAIGRSMPGLLNKINEAVRTGNIENAGTFLTDAFMNASQEQQGAGLAERGTFIDFFNQLKASSVALNLSKGKLKGMTDADMEAQSEETKKKLRESGKSTVAMNNLTTNFLKMQDALIPNLASASDSLVNITETINAGADKISDFFGTSMTTQRRMKMIDAKVQQKAKGVGEGATDEDMDDMVTYLREQSRNDLIQAGGWQKAAGYTAKLIGILADPLEDFFGTGSKGDSSIGMGYTATELSNMYRKREGVSIPGGTNSTSTPSSTPAPTTAPAATPPSSTPAPTTAPAATPPGAAAPVEKRQRGGRVSAGASYLVGEAGPEIIAPENSGTVINNGGLQQIMVLVQDSISLAKIMQSEKRTNQQDTAAPVQLPNAASLGQLNITNDILDLQTQFTPAMLNMKKGMLSNQATAPADDFGSELIDSVDFNRQNGSNTVQLAKRLAELVKHMARKSESDKQLASTDN